LTVPFSEHEVSTTCLLNFVFQQLEPMPNRIPMGLSQCLTGNRAGGMVWRMRKALAVLPVLVLLVQAVSVAPASAGTVYLKQFNTTGQAALHGPYGLITDNLGNVYVADTSAHRIVKFDKDGNGLAAFGQGDSTTAGKPGHEYYPASVTFANDVLYVIDASSYVNVYSTAGVLMKQFGGPGSGDGQLNVPLGIGSDCAGDIFVADSRNNRVVEFNGNGDWMRDIGVGEVGVPTGIAVDDTLNGGTCVVGAIYVSDEYDGKIVEFAGNGQMIQTIGQAGSGEMQFQGPEELALEKAPGGADQALYVAESGTFRVQQLLSTDGGGHWSFGEFITDGAQRLGDVHAVALTPTGNLLILDTGGNLYEYANEPAALKLVSTANHRSRIKSQADLHFEVKYNQLDKKCGSVAVSATLRTGGHTFTLHKRLDNVENDYVLARLAMSNAQLGSVERAWKNGHAVTVHATANGICDNNVHVSAQQDTKI
jgi:hypothetical protein